MFETHQANVEARRRADAAVVYRNFMLRILASLTLVVTWVFRVMAATYNAVSVSANFVITSTTQLAINTWTQVTTTPPAVVVWAKIMVSGTLKMAVLVLTVSMAIGAILSIFVWSADLLLKGFEHLVADTQIVAIKIAGNCSVFFDGLTESIGRMKLGVIDFIDAHDTNLLFVSVTMNFLLAYALTIKEGILARLDKATRAYDANLQAIMQRHVEETQAVGNAIANLDIKDQIGQALGVMGEETDMNGMTIKVTYHR